MQIVLLATDLQYGEWTAQGMPGGGELVRVSGFEAMREHPNANAYIDLDFTPSPERIGVLETLQAPVIVGSVLRLPLTVAGKFVRINNWPGMLQAALVEAAGPEALQASADAVFSHFGKQAVWLPDRNGLVTPRVVSMIINEAYHALSEGVSSEEAIDTAMKLGTNYPLGPFAWARQIGLECVLQLLNALAEEAPHYRPVSNMG